MDGIIIINKTKGCTSHDIVYKVKKIFKEKVGHTGTLDPNATGVLPILIGNGTKLSKYLINHDKKYIATIQLGIKTDTADGEGTIIEKQEVNENILIERKVREVLKKFIGQQTQTPPMYSAIKINGKKLYEYARKGQTIEIPQRKIEIYNIDLLNIENKQKEIVIEVSCSKGTYIRSLCEDISRKLGTIGYMKELQRTVVGKFDIENSITLEDLENNKNDEKYIEQHIITMEKLLNDNESIILRDDELEKFLNGVKLQVKNKNGIYKIYNNEIFIGTGIVENNSLKRDICKNNF